VINDRAWKANGKDTTNDVSSWFLKMYVFPVPELNLPPAMYYPLSKPYVCYVNYTCHLTWTKKDFSNDTETIQIDLPTNSSSFISYVHNKKNLQTDFTFTPRLESQIGQWSIRITLRDNELPNFYNFRLNITLEPEDVKNERLKNQRDDVVEIAEVS